MLMVEKYFEALFCRSANAPYHIYFRVAETDTETEIKYGSEGIFCDCVERWVIQLLTLHLNRFLTLFLSLVTTICSSLQDSPFYGFVPVFKLYGRIILLWIFCKYIFYIFVHGIFPFRDTCPNLLFRL